MPKHPINTVTEQFGRMEISRPFDPERDGWMNEQLTEDDMPCIQQAFDVIALFNEVNRLRRQNWEQARELEMLRKTAFGNLKL